MPPPTFLTLGSAGICSRSLLACAAVVLSAAGASGCGGVSDNPRSTLTGSGAPARGGAALAAGEHDGDADNDSLGVGPHDPDNDAVPSYGPAATPIDRREITALVKRYYAAAGAGDGARACSLLHWLAAEALVEEHNRGKGPSSLRGTTCAQIAAKLFKRHRRELTEGVTALSVTIVQVRGNHGWAVVDLGGAREYVALTRRQGAVWELSAMLGYEEPL